MSKKKSPGKPYRDKRKEKLKKQNYDYEYSKG